MSHYPTRFTPQLFVKSAVFCVTSQHHTLLHKMLYLVGLGLADETDITVKGLEAVKKADRVYLEAYTSILLVDKEKLVHLPGPA